MFVPIFPYTKVINKTIIYSDTVLPLKEMGNDIKVTCISDVSEIYLESCLKKVFETNSNVIFNTIQYSRSDKKVYFYTDKEISTKEWNDRNVREYKPLTSSKEILEEIKNVLNQEMCDDCDCISLYIVLNLLKEKEAGLKKIKFELLNSIDRLMSTYNSSWLNYYEVKRFDFMNMQLTISYNKDSVTFTKKDGDLVILKSNFYGANEMLVKCGKLISEYFDKCIENRGYFEDKKRDIQSFNSNFLVDIDEFNVSIYLKTNSPNFKVLNRIFQLSARAWDSSVFEPFEYNCNSNNVAELIRGNENKIFDRVFVKISDCPEWMREKLYEIRHQQIKQLKRLQLVRKVFPWMKK